MSNYKEYIRMMEEFGARFDALYASQSKTPRVLEEQRIEMDGRQHVVRVTIYPALAGIEFDTNTATVSPITQHDKQQQVAETVARNCTRSAVTSISENGEDELEVVFALAAVRTHPYLFSSMVDAGVSHEEVVRAAKSGIDCHIGEGNIARILMWGDHDAIIGDRYSAYYRVESFSSKEQLERLKTITNRIARVGNIVLPPIAKELTGNDKVSHRFEFIFRGLSFRGSS